MKVILLGATPPPVGGIAQWTVRMLNSQLKKGWQVDFIDEKVIGGRECFGSNSRKNYYYEAKRWLGVWVSLKKKLKNPEAAVVHACPIASMTSMLAEYVSMLITKRYKKAFVVHFRCTVPNMISSKIQKRLLKRFCDKSSYIIALNVQTREFLELITETPIVVIPNFVDSNELDEKKRIRKDIKKIVYVGGVIREKGCCDIIELAKKFPNIEFRLVGRPDEDVLNMAKGQSNVVLVGVKDKKGVKEELNEADIFIFLSRYKGEGFSNALAEAMAAGLPCIVSDWAANADMVENGKGGFVVEPGNIKLAQEAIEAMYAIDIRKSQSDFNKSKVRGQYESHVILDRYVDCYEKAIGTKFK